MKKRLLCPLIILAVALVSVPLSTPSHAQDGDVPTYQFFYCPFPTPEGESEDGDNITLDCGYLYVPQDRNDPNGLELELAFAYLHSRSDNPHPAPIVYLEGGPGGSALSGIDLWLDSPFRDEYDIILIDQRGTGYSYPRLHCFEIDALEFEEFDPTDDEEDVAYYEALEECQTRFAAEGIDLSDFTTANNAADIADLRRAFDLDEISLYGVSYGTRLALTVMRDYPEGIRGVILDSTYPPVVDGYNEQAINGYRSFQVLFADCMADAGCNAAFPNLESTFIQLVNDLNLSPIITEDGFELTGDSLVNTMFLMFYDTASVPYLPLMIDELSRGETTTYDELMGGVAADDEAFEEDDDLVFAFVDELFYLAEDLDDTEYNIFAEIEPYDLERLAIWVEDVFVEEDSDYLLGLLDEMTQTEQEAVSFYIWEDDVSDTQGMYDAVECNEEIPFNDLDSVNKVSAPIPDNIEIALVLDIEAQFDTCESWDSGIAGAIEDQPVVSDIPTLILAGEYDPITPPSWGQTAAETLSNGYYFEFPGVGHGAIDGGDCPVQIGLDFIADPTTEPDGSCIAAMTGPVFVIE